MSDERFPEDLQKLADQFLATGWTELRFKNGDTEVLFSLDPNTPGLGSARTPAVAAPSTSQDASTRAHWATPTAPISQPIAPAAVDPSWVGVVAPNLGTFYRSAKPGAAPFVEIGASVDPDTEICLLEVMKLFTSVKAGRAGTIKQICAADAELVEAGQVLFYLLPAGA